MLDLDKSLDFSCPEGCGQIAVSCTLRDILEGRPLVCASCGAEFHPADHPDNPVDEDKPVHAMFHL